MSEVAPARTGGSRGRGGSRGGRGGYRGGRTSSRTQKDDQENLPVSLEDQGEVGELKRKFGDKIPFLREICPGWSDEDLVFALEETKGDVEAAVDRISSGTISQWGEVKKKQPKAKDAAVSGDGSSSRGRGRGGLETRGRGRGTERGGRGGRGARTASQANGTKQVTKSDDWEVVPPTSEIQAEAAGAWDKPTNGDTATHTESAAPVEEKKSAAPASSAKAGGWASLFAKPPPAPKPVPTAQPESLPAPTIAAPVEDHAQELPPPIEPQVVEDSPSELPSAPHSEGPNDLPPSNDELTENNLEQLPDVSHPPASQTVASTTASTQNPLDQAASAAKAPVRPASGYAATALKATAAGRSASFMRKVKEQQEAVVMPGHHAVEKTAVQFGKMGLNGDGDDFDEDREEPETRTPLPDDSPVAPRASLPPGLPEAQQQQQQAAPAEIQAPTEPQAQRQAPGLPPAPQQAHQSTQQAASGFGDPYRYGQGAKTYDPFGQPASQQAPPAAQEPFASQVPGQQQTAGQQNMSGYYDREAYAQYYGYGQHHDGQRAASGFGGTSAQDIQSQYATAGPQRGYSQHEGQNSGSNTPAPTGPSQQSQASQQQQHMGAGQHQGYPYGYPSSYGQQYPQYSQQQYMNQMSHQHRYGANRPMFDDARRQGGQQQQQQEDYYGNQYAYGKNQHYGGGQYNSSMYGQPQQQYSYDHASSASNMGSYGGRGDNGYGRSGSTQPSEQQTAATSGSFSAAQDPFARGSSGFGHSQALGQHGGSHQGSEDALKASGPSPALQSGRPGSTTNASQGQQSGLGQQQSQQGFGAYPQYGGGFGNFGGQQQGGGHQASQYGGYGSSAFGNTYAGYGGSGRGWNNAH
ncbi:uncharacterized protein AB675_1974 [Cyphellophora attinorum]|uniref:RNA polymerase II degradation factor 1 n=1 Tax=Cyphellophora attinorum TaxID=1664694 RepID=A0A0N1P0Y8_9EURO|nr:uncharacterized protein AB675_1974 [Phialophora attinorum]KPI42823.1 hypothetical protein AB675_1974 [Phialophora attinorum]